MQRLSELRARPHAAKIAIRDVGKVRLIESRDVLAVVAQGNYVLLELPCGSHCLRESISAVAEKLEAYGFVRIHRSVLVNRLWVEEICQDSSGKPSVCLKGGKEFTVSRTFRNNLSQLAELWLGSAALSGRDVG
jgi:two-component system LytT family response regulator